MADARNARQTQSTDVAPSGERPCVRRPGCPRWSATACVAMLLVASSICRPLEADCPAPDFPVYRGADADVVVAPWGDDSHDGTAERPVQTFKRAAFMSHPGAIVLIRGGIYPQQQVILQGGAEGQPVTFAAWPTELPVIDGSEVSIKRHQGLLQINASDVIVDGVEVRNSRARGVSVYDSDRVTLRRAHVHQIATKGYAGSGDDLLVESSVFENLVMENVNGAGPRPWPGGISTWHRPDGEPVSRLQVINNKISRVWGECVGLVLTRDSQVAGNQISDCYSVGIYLDNTQNAHIERNILFSSSDEFNRIDNDRAMVAINLAVEYYESAEPQMTKGIVVANNLIRNVDRGIGFFDDPANKSERNSFSNILLAHNVICDTRHAAIRLDEPRRGTSSDNRLLNNLLCAGESSPDNSIEIGHLSSWFIDHNAYNHAPADSAGPNHVRLSEDSPAGGINLDGDEFSDWRPEPESVLVGRAVALDEVEADAVCTPRPTSDPSIGPREL